MSEPDPDERAFIERLVARDERAFNELVELYGDRVYRLMRRMLGRSDEAEDMAQEVFVQVFKAIHQFRGDAKLGTWIYRVAINLCKNRSKYLSRRHSGSEDELEAMADRAPFTEAKGVTLSDVSAPDQMVQGYQVEAIVRRCILELEADFREVLVLRDVEELTYEEIGEITGLAEGTVKSRLHRARSMLKEKVERLLGEKYPMSDDRESGPVFRPSDPDDADVKSWLKGALGDEPAASVDVLAGVQKKLRERSGGKFYADEWSTAKQPPTMTFLVTSVLMLVVVLVAYAVLAPLRGHAEGVQTEPVPVDILPTIHK